jgi:hypothetical protein
MTEREPKQVIVDFFSAPREGDVRVDTATFHSLKERTIPGHGLHMVAFRDEVGQQYHGHFFLDQDATGAWRVRGASWNEGIVGTRTPTRDQPWVSVFGGGDERTFYAGGNVVDHNRDVMRVRLISPNGVVLEDTVENGLVLFLTDQYVEMPLKVELYNRSGEIISTHSALPNS